MDFLLGVRVEHVPQGRQHPPQLAGQIHDEQLLQAEGEVLQHQKSICHMPYMCRESVFKLVVGSTGNQ